MLTDPSGAPVSEVLITAQPDPSSTSQPLTAVSSADGSYSLSLPEGSYRVRFSRTSFTTREVAITLAPGESRVMNLHLELHPLSDSVIVTAQAIPATSDQTTAPTDVISAEVIQQRQAVSIPDLLQFSPGIAIGRTGPFGGTTSVFLNGGNSDFTKVLIDGTAINPPGSAVDFSNLTTENIDKVEVVRGAESALYGSDAVSGVIQLFTHQGDTRIPAFTVYSEGGGFSSARGGADLSGLLGKFDYSGAASYFSTEGQGPGDAFINRTLSGNFGYSFSDTNQLRLSLRNNTSDAEIPGATLITPPSLYQRYDQKIFSANARWDFLTGSHWHNEISGTETYTRQHSFNPDQSYYATDPNAFCPQTNPTAVPTQEFCDYTYDTLLSFNIAGFTAQSTYVSRNFIATAGYQYLVENGGLSYVSPGHLRRNNQAGYLDFRYTPFPRLVLNLGGRVEDNSNFGTRFVPRVGGSFVLHYSKGILGDTRYTAFYGQGIKEPRFDQTFGTDPCNPGNPDLKPEASKGWTTGIEQKLLSDRWKISADYFYTRFYDIISFSYFPAPNPNGCGTYLNTDLAIARGVNVVSEFRFNKWLFLTGNYTYDNSRIIQSENPFFDPSLEPGTHLIRRPVNSGSFGLNVAYARFNWNFIGYFTGTRVDVNYYTYTLAPDPGYARFDMAFSYNLIRGLFLTARATNIFDKQYQDAYGYPALGRDYRFGLRYTFAGKN
jgi:vitamin B12 transporter